jgi:hypothetical protein
MKCYMCKSLSILKMAVLCVLVNNMSKLTPIFCSTWRAILCEFHWTAIYIYRKVRRCGPWGTTELSYQQVYKWCRTEEQCLLGCFNSANNDDVFWDITPCRSSKNRRFGRIYRFHVQGNETLESSQLAARICLTTDGEDSPLQWHLYGVVAVDMPLRGAFFALAASWEDSRVLLT